MGACGEGGAVTTNDENLAAKVGMLRDHGQSKKYHHEMEGYNGRCDAIQAAALRVKLKRLPAWNEARRKNAQRYFELLKDTDGIKLPVIHQNCLSVFHRFVIQVEKRDSVQEALAKVGISTGLHYPIPLHLQKAYEHIGLAAGSFPVAEACAKRLLSLPLYPELTEEQIRCVSSSLKKIVNLEPELNP
jgi:dTDP-4-amino-4,6-dideoxygalactose transaminase